MVKELLITGNSGQGDSYLTDCSNSTRILQEAQFGEVYNFGAQSHVVVSLEVLGYKVGCLG